ncbi:MAG: hypothetical protein LBB84_13150 [Tannerellaceae bacterium]|nr:hypothetical protein [Tannerellaceae bacterium]
MLTYYVQTFGQQKCNEPYSSGNKFNQQPDSIYQCLLPYPPARLDATQDRASIQLRIEPLYS